MKHSVSKPRPFLPSDLPRIPPSRAFFRAAFAIGKNAMETNPNMRRGADHLAEDLFPNDRVAIALTRAATGPALTTSGTWVGALTQNIAADFVASLAPSSAGARLIDAGLQLSLDSINALLIPQRTTAPDPASFAWTSEAGAFPVRNYTLAAATLGPVRKLIATAALTRETAQYANGEAVIETLLKEDAAAALDASLFSTAAASSSRPAGLLNGVTPNHRHDWRRHRSYERRFWQARCRVRRSWRQH